MTAAKLQAESNHTSRMSVSFLSVGFWHAGQVSPVGRNSESGRAYQAPAPSFATTSATRFMSSASMTAWLHSAHTAVGMGTPQVRWREMVQSGRVESMPWMRSRPQAGTHVTAWSICASAFWRRPVVSIEMNHCGVARKMTGFLLRQLCG